MKNLPIQFKILAIITIIMLLLSIVDSYKKVTDFYNKVIFLKLDYKSLEEKQLSNFDALYNFFKDKQSNTNLNKESFIEITKIIMDNRKDGKNLAWKWNQENQHIPYEEFTYFYKKLDETISERYEDYMIIENNKQQMAKNHNYLISSYPNNLYNKFFNFKEIKYSKLNIK